ncbi:MAG: TlpA disulfide reductase family protein [Gemmatimonadales bacterium]
MPGDGMTPRRRQWALVAGLVMTVAFALALAVRLRPQIDLLAVGDRAPAFRALDAATGRSVSLEDYRGKVLLVNVWATWCLPCRVEMPSLERLQRRFAGTDFRIVAVSVDKDDSSVVNDFVRQLGLTFDVLHDREGAIERLYRTTGVPESFVLDRQGVIVKKVIGAAEWDGPVHESLITRLLDGR